MKRYCAKPSIESGQRKQASHTSPLGTTMSDFRPLKRINYFSSRQLTAEDFQVEQQYSLERFRRHNRFFHGFGVVYGLRVYRKGAIIRIEPGLALDCLGNEIVVDEVVSLELPSDLPGSSNIYVCVKYSEKGCHGLVVDQNVESASMVEESFEWALLPANPQRNHLRKNSRWLTCGRFHEFAIARIRRNSSGWGLDRRFRAPLVK